MPDLNTVIFLEYLSGRYAVAVFPLGQIAGKIFCIAAAIPGLDADKRCIFACRRPDAEQRSVEFYRHEWFFLPVCQPNPPSLFSFDDQCVPVKQRRRKAQKAILQQKTVGLFCHQSLIVKQAIGKVAGQIKSQIAAVHSAAAGRTEERWMCADREEKAFI